MTGLQPFIERLLSDGVAEVPAQPSRPEASASLLDQLGLLHERHCLAVAGPQVPFDSETATWAASCLWWACYFLVHRSESPAEAERQLPRTRTPQSAAAHLSADPLLRYLVQIHRRSTSLAPNDVLTDWLRRVLRTWPLTGVLADLEEGPLTAVGFDGHPGLCMLYAERLAQRPRAAWLPEEREREYVELVFTERGLVVPTPPVAQAENSSPSL